MTYATVAIVGGSILGGVIAGQGAKSAASTQAAGQTQAADTQRQIFNQINQQEQPFIQAGYGATSRLNQLLGIAPLDQFGNPVIPGQTPQAVPMQAAPGPAGNFSPRLIGPNGSPAPTSGPQAAGGSGKGLFGPGAAPGTYSIAPAAVPLSSVMSPSTGTYHFGNVAQAFAPAAPQATNIPPSSISTPPLNQTSGVGVPARFNSTPIPGGTPYGQDAAGVPAIYTGGSAPPGDYGSLTRSFTPTDFLNNLDPGYQFRLDTGAQATRNADTPGVGALSGPALKDLMNFNQASASQEYGNAFNRFTTQQNNIFARLSGIAGLGQNAASNTGVAGTSLGTGIAQAQAAAAGSQAAGTVGVANAIGGGVNTLASIYGANGGFGGSGGGFIPSGTTGDRSS